MTRFDEAYYRRFYESRRSRVQGPKEVARLATVVTTIIEATHGPLRTVLDVGAGTGLWRDWFAKKRPRVQYRSVDVSAYACQRYGHEQHDITTWREEAQFDIVVCQGVLPYFGAREAERAIRNLTAMTGLFLYLEAVTAQDLATISDQARTDSAMHGRPGEWYRQRLGRHFRQIGFGLWVRRDAGIPLWELEYSRED